MRIRMQEFQNPVLWIRIGFNAYPDPAFLASVDPEHSFPLKRMSLIRLIFVFNYDATPDIHVCSTFEAFFLFLFFSMCR
jgi:hypothetical protein